MSLEMLENVYGARGRDRNGGRPVRPSDEAMGRRAPARAVRSVVVADPVDVRDIAEPIPEDPGR